MRQIEEAPAQQILNTGCTVGQSYVRANADDVADGLVIANDSCWSCLCRRCRPSHAQGYPLAECSCSCCCCWCLLPLRLSCACCIGSCKGCFQHPKPFAEWNCMYTAALNIMQTLTAAVPINNFYAVQTITDVPIPSLILPPSIRISEVNVGNVTGEWLEIEGVSSPKVILYFHGGAFVLCRARTERMIAANLLLAIGGCKLFSADYPRPPKDPFPSALNAALQTWQWLTQDQGVLPKDLVVAGDSAGGNLAISLMLHLQTLGNALPAGALLLSPWIDISPFESESWRDFAKFDYIAQRTMIEEFVSLYATNHSGNDPLLAPIHASPDQLRNLPPLWISVGGAEVLRSSIEQFSSKVSTAGNVVQVFVGEGMPHVFQLCFFAFKPPRAEQLPRYVCCFRACCTNPHSDDPKHPVWESLEDAHHFIWSQKIWGHL